MNNSVHPVGDNLPATPPPPSVQTSPQPQQIVVGGVVHQPSAPPPIYIPSQPVYVQQAPQPNYVYIKPSAYIRGKPTPLWLDIMLIVSAMMIVLGQLLCLKQAEDRFYLFVKWTPTMKVVGFFIAATQMTSEKVFYQVLYLIGVILVVVFGLIAAHGYDVGVKGWQLMLWGIVWWSVDIISYGLMVKYGKPNISTIERYMIVYLVSVVLSFILFAVGWGVSFGKLFARVPQKAVQIILQICTLFTAIMVMLGPALVIVFEGKFAIGTAGCVIGLIFIPAIYGTNAWLIYMKEKKMKRGEFVVDPSKLTVSVEDGKAREVNQPLIVH